MSDDEPESDGPEILESEPNAEDNAYAYSNYNPPPVTSNIHVIDLDVDASESFSKFVQTYHDTSTRDYTSKINKRSKPATRVVFQSHPAVEGPLEKYQRLEAELKEFKDELAALQDAGRISDVSVDLLKEIGVIKSQLLPFKISKKFAPFLNAHFPTKEESLHEKGITAKLRNKIKKSEGRKESKVQDEEAKGICYEFYQHKPAKSKSAPSQKALEKRLKALETTIGTSELQIFPDIRSTIIYVGKKMDGLNDKQLKDLQTKMDYLSRELKNLEKKKTKLSAAKKSDYQKKIRELYSLMALWDEASNTLPIINKRLQSVKALNDAGKDSKKQLKDVVSKKNDVAVALDKNRDRLKKVKGQFSSAMEDIKDVVGLEEAFSNLAKKMSEKFS